MKAIVALLGIIGIWCVVLVNVAIGLAFFPWFIAVFFMVPSAFFLSGGLIAWATSQRYSPVQLQVTAALHNANVRDAIPSANARLVASADEPEPCALCGGVLLYLGAKDKADDFRCRDCGFSYTSR